MHLCFGSSIAIAKNRTDCAATMHCTAFYNDSAEQCIIRKIGASIVQDIERRRYYDHSEHSCRPRLVRSQKLPSTRRPTVVLHLRWVAVISTAAGASSSLPSLDFGLGFISLNLGDGVVVVFVFVIIILLQCPARISSMVTTLVAYCP